ncbi:MAG: hypothetical protein GF401_20110 [Chitinivibrionales bacterium]|nr:hypothetical protein [Chitinivibrionales bacterium]
MSIRLRQYLVDAYIGHTGYLQQKTTKDLAIQVDDQDDNDILADFCNIFVSVGKNNSFEIEISGNFPIAREIADFAEIYDGHADLALRRVILRLNTNKTEAIKDLATKIRKTAHNGYSVNNPNWEKISARTISSLHRFARVIEEYKKSRSAGLD